MTCCVGIEIDGGVLLAGDTMAQSGQMKLPRHGDAPKTFMRGEFGYAWSGSVRHSQIVRYGFNPPDIPVGCNLDAYMCTLWVDALREHLKDVGYSKVENNVETSPDYGLVAVRGRLYCCYTNFEVSRLPWGYNAVGCGAPYALGALRVTGATWAKPELTPRERATLALEAAEYHSSGVQRPWTFMTVPTRPSSEKVEAEWQS